MARMRSPPLGAATLALMSHLEQAYAADIKTFSYDLDTLDRDPGCKRLAWRHGVSKNVLDKKLRVSEVANWIEFQVLPTRVKRGRG